MSCKDKERKQKRLSFNSDKSKDRSIKLNKRNQQIDGIRVIGTTSDSIGASLFL